MRRTLQQDWRAREWATYHRATVDLAQWRGRRGEAERARSIVACMIADAEIARAAARVAELATRYGIR